MNRFASDHDVFIRSMGSRGSLGGLAWATHDVVHILDALGKDIIIVETVGVSLKLWYPLGGTQFPPLIIVPLEMVLSFFLIGTSMGIVMSFPERIRESELKLFKWVK